MTLLDYLKQPGALTRTELCAELGISQGRLSQLRDKVDWPPELALKIERATGHAVSASAISPIVKLAREGSAGRTVA